MINGNRAASRRNLTPQLLLVAALLLAFPFSRPSPGQSAAHQNIRAAHTSKLNVAGFIENKGQFIDAQRRLIPGVLFKASLEGVDLYVTTDGITYVFTRMVKQRRSERIGTDARLDEGERGRVEWRRMQMRLAGAIIKRENVLAERPVAQGTFNYYLSHRPQGITGVNAFHQITIRNIYPGIDWRLSDDGARGFKQDFIVHPGALSSAIRMRYMGAGNVAAINGGKALRIKTTLGEIEEGALLSHQGNPNQPIVSRYRMSGSEVRFVVGSYDAQRDLIIDPPLHLVWATLYGSNGVDGPWSLALDAANNLYVVGYTTSLNFPTQAMGSAYFQPNSISGGYDTDAFIIKFNHAGARQWATLYGSNGGDIATGVVTDASGNVYVTGWTSGAGSSFPTQAPTASAVTVQSNSGGSNDAFLLKFNAAGIRQWATLYGGNGYDVARGITIDRTGNVYIVGITMSSNLPVNPPPVGSVNWQTVNGGCVDTFLAKYKPTGAREWARYYGGSGADHAWAIAYHDSPSFLGVFITGSTSSPDLPLGVFIGGYNQPALGGNEDAFIFAIPPDGRYGFWSNYYGGDGFDAGYGITSSALTGGYDLYITGVSTPVSTTANNAFPTHNPGGGAFYQSGYTLPPPYLTTFSSNYSDAFILRIDHSNSVVWATLFGGTNNDSGQAVVVDKLNNVHVTGRTSSFNFPAYFPGGNVYFDGMLSGPEDVFIASFSPSSVRQWATFVGGDGHDFPRTIGISGLNCLFVAGEFNSNPPTLTLLNPGSVYFQNTSSYTSGHDEGFVMKFCY